MSGVSYKINPLRIRLGRKESFERQGGFYEEKTAFQWSGKHRRSEITRSYHVTREARGSDAATMMAAGFCPTFVRHKSGKEVFCYFLKKSKL